MEEFVMETIVKEFILGCIIIASIIIVFDDFSAKLMKTVKRHPKKIMAALTVCILIGNSIVQPFAKTEKEVTMSGIVYNFGFKGNADVSGVQTDAKAIQKPNVQKRETQKTKFSVTYSDFGVPIDGLYPDFVDLTTECTYKDLTAPRYAYQQLTKSQKDLYKIILSYSNTFQREGKEILLGEWDGEIKYYAFKVSVSENGSIYTPQDLEIASNAFRCDFPEFFWFESCPYVYYQFDNQICQFFCEVKPEYVSAQYRKYIIEGMQKTVSEYKKLVKEDMSDSERELAIHDELCKQVFYQCDKVRNKPSSSSSAHTVVGPLTEIKGGVCEAYAKVFSLLLTHVGVANNYLVGDTISGGLHAWNQVKIGEYWYNTDITWNDTYNKEGDEIGYRFYNLTDEEFEKNDHKISSYPSFNVYSAQICKKGYPKKVHLSEYDTDICMITPDKNVPFVGESVTYNIKMKMKLTNLKKYAVEIYDGIAYEYVPLSDKKITIDTIEKKPVFKIVEVGKDISFIVPRTNLKKGEKEKIIFLYSNYIEEGKEDWNEVKITNKKVLQFNEEENTLIAKKKGKTSVTYNVKYKGQVYKKKMIITVK